MSPSNTETTKPSDEPLLAIDVPSDELTLGHIIPLPSQSTGDTEMQQVSESSSQATPAKAVGDCKASTDRKVDYTKLLPQRYIRHLLQSKPRDLRNFRSSRELLTVTRDVIIALMQCHFEADIVHGDIAPQHIMVNEDGSGMLVDWDIPGRENRNSRRKDK